MTEAAIEDAQTRLSALSREGAREAHDREAADLTLSHMDGFERGRDAGRKEAEAEIASLRQQLAQERAAREKAETELAAHERRKQNHAILLNEVWKNWRSWNPEWKDATPEYGTLLQWLWERQKKLEEALRPLADAFHGSVMDDAHIADNRKTCTIVEGEIGEMEELTVGDYRRARAAAKEGQP